MVVCLHIWDHWLDVGRPFFGHKRQLLVFGVWFPCRSAVFGWSILFHFLIQEKNQQRMVLMLHLESTVICFLSEPSTLSLSFSSVFKQKENPAARDAYDTTGDDDLVHKGHHGPVESCRFSTGDIWARRSKHSRQRLLENVCCFHSLRSPCPGFRSSQVCSLLLKCLQDNDRKPMLLRKCA